MTPEQRKMWDKIELNCNWPPAARSPYSPLFDPNLALSVTEAGREALSQNSKTAQSIPVDRCLVPL